MIKEHNSPGELVYLMLIAGRKKREALLAAMSKGGARIMNVMYGRGSVTPLYLKEVFGLVPEENKVVITCLLPRAKSDAMIEMLIERFDFNKPNTGIAFTIPVERLSF